MAFLEHTNSPIPLHTKILCNPTLVPDFAIPFDVRLLTGQEARDGVDVSARSLWLIGRNVDSVEQDRAGAVHCRFLEPDKVHRGRRRCCRTRAHLAFLFVAVE